jgi:hypothetical protein
MIPCVVMNKPQISLKCDRFFPNTKLEYVSQYHFEKIILNIGGWNSYKS